jgi:hypothetical protein
MYVGLGGVLGQHFREDSRGASLVELALALPILIMLLVGMVSAAIAYNHQLALAHASREGGRYAATLPVTNFASMEEWLGEIITQVVDDATGTLDPGADGRWVCVAYVFPNGSVGTDQTARRILNGGTLGGIESGQQCMTDGRPDTERRVQVVVRRNSEFTVVFFSSNITLDSEGVSRFEAALGT